VLRGFLSLHGFVALHGFVELHGIVAIHEGFSWQSSKRFMGEK